MVGKEGGGGGVENPKVVKSQTSHKTLTVKFQLTSSTGMDATRSV